MLICRFRPALRSLLALLGGLALAASYAADAAPSLSWEDRDFDGLPDWCDPYPDDFANNTIWWEGEFLIDGERVTVSGWFADEGPDWNDDDGDWLPNFIDPYADDPTNNTAFWNGAAWIDGQWQEIAEPYPASSVALLDLTDTDEDTLPDVFDPYPEDASNNTAVWQGGEFVIDGETRVLTGAGERYAADGGDVDADHIPDFADPYPEDAGNDGREPVFAEPVAGGSVTSAPVDGATVGSASVAAGVSTPTVALNTPEAAISASSTGGIPAPTVPPPTLDDAAVLALLSTGSLPAQQTPGQGTAADETPPDPLSAATAAEVEQLVAEINELAQRPSTFNAEADAETLGWITQMLAVEPGADPAAALAAALAFRQTPQVTVQDGDGDGLDDLEETLTYLTDLTNPDTDGDGFFDGWEIAYSLDSLDAEDNATADTDNDGLSNEEELTAGTHPLHADSDYGGVIDGIETRIARLRVLLGENTPQAYSATNPLDPQDDEPPDVPQQENQPPTPPEPEDPDYHAPLDGDGDGVFTPDDPDDHDPAVPGDPDMPQNDAGAGGDAGGQNGGGEEGAGGGEEGVTPPPEQPDPFADVDGDGVPAALDPDDRDPLVPNRPQLIDEPPLPPEEPEPPGGTLQLPPEIQGPPRTLEEQWKMEKALREKQLQERRDRLTAQHKEGIAQRGKQRQEQRDLNDLLSHPHGNHGLGVKYAGSRGRRSEDNENGALPFLANEDYAETTAFKRQQNNDALRAWLGPKLDRMTALSGQSISSLQRQSILSQLKGVMSEGGNLNLKAAAGIISAALEQAGIHFLPDQPTVGNGGRVVPGLVQVLSMNGGFGGGTGGAQDGAGSSLSAFQQDEEDADDDGYSNGEERALGSDPDDFNSVPGIPPASITLGLPPPDLLGAHDEFMRQQSLARRNALEQDKIRRLIEAAIALEKATAAEKARARHEQQAKKMLTDRQQRPVEVDDGDPEGFTPAATPVYSIMRGADGEEIPVKQLLYTKDDDASGKLYAGAPQPVTDEREQVYHFHYEADVYGGDAILATGANESSPLVMHDRAFADGIVSKLNAGAPAMRGDMAGMAISYLGGMVQDGSMQFGGYLTGLDSELANDLGLSLGTTGATLGGLIQMAGGMVQPGTYFDTADYIVGGSIRTYQDSHELGADTLEATVRAGYHGLFSWNLGELVAGIAEEDYARGLQGLAATTGALAGTAQTGKMVFTRAPKSLTSTIVERPIGSPPPPSFADFLKLITDGEARVASVNTQYGGVAVFNMAPKPPPPAQQLVDLTDFRSTHILNRHKAGAGISGKTEFPASWSDQQILHHISDVATDPAAVTGMGKWNTPYSIGVRDGVEIRVDFYPTNHPTHAGKISTAYPINVPPNP